MVNGEKVSNADQPVNNFVDTCRLHQQQVARLVSGGADQSLCPTTTPCVALTFMTEKRRKTENEQDSKGYSPTPSFALS